MKILSVSVGMVVWSIIGYRLTGNRLLAVMWGVLLAMAAYDLFVLEVQ